MEVTISRPIVVEAFPVEQKPPEYYLPGQPGHGRPDEFNRTPGEPGYAQKLGHPMYYQPGHPGFGQPDEYGRQPGRKPGQSDQLGYGQPGQPGFYTQGQPGYGRADYIGRPPNQSGYGQFGPSVDEAQQRKLLHIFKLFHRILLFLSCLTRSTP